MQRPSSIPAAAGTEWTGFQAHEFGRNEGTNWRSATGRQSLAPILARELRALDPDFISYGVERSPEIHFALGRRYKGSEISGFTASKLVVYAHGPGDESLQVPAQVVPRYYIEKGDGSEPFGSPENASDWDWPLFRACLRRTAFQGQLTKVMARHSLGFGDYALGRFRASLGWTARIEADEIVGRQPDGTEVVRGWPALAEHLAAVPETTWLDLHVWRTWPAAEAIAAGQPFALNALAPVLRDLAGCYLDIVPSTPPAR